jgi:glycosyltransferase involved in cell wall biosynthesis
MTANTPVSGAGLRLLHVITTLDVGGAEMHLLSQVRGQAAAGARVRVAYLKGQGSLAGDFRAAGAEWVGRVPPTRAWALWPHLRWANLVHSHLLKADMLTAVLATLAGRRSALVSGKHNDEQVLMRPAVGLIHGLLGNLPTKTVVLSDHVGRFVARYGRVRPSKLVRIYYGLDPQPFEAAARERERLRSELLPPLGVSTDDVVFICVARFAPQKAHAVLLQAFALARQRLGSKLKLLLVGADPFGDGRERTEQVARELGLEGAAIFTGIRRDVPALLAASDVFTMASLWEGLGLVFLEAMATDLPVLATRVSAVPEVVVEGETGLLVAPNDAADLAVGMEALARDGALRRRLGQAGHARVRAHFGLETMVSTTLALYRRIAGLPS